MALEGNGQLEGQDLATSIYITVGTMHHTSFTHLCPAWVFSSEMLIRSGARGV